MHRIGAGLFLMGLGLAVPALAQVSVAPGVGKSQAPVQAPVQAPAKPAAAAVTPAAKAAAPVEAAKSAPAPTVAAAATPAPSSAAAPAKKPAVGRECTRLPLSDIQFGRENTITVARGKLEEYAQKVAKERGWKNGYTRANETATCEDYLWLPVGGQEYKCLVTATFCRK